MKKLLAALLFLSATAGLDLFLGAVPGWGLEPPAAVVTIFPIGDLMRSLAGPAVKVSVMLPPGASPHHYEITPAQARIIAKSDLFVSVGGVDRWAERFSRVGSARRIVLVESLGGAVGANPHLWLDPVLVRTRIVPLLAQALERMAPDQRGAIEERRRTLAGDLDELDAEIRRSLGPARGRSFVAFHAAWTPFARRYGLEETAVVEGSHQSEPSAARLALVIEEAKRAGTTALLVDAQVRSRTARAVAAELGGEVITVDPLGGPGLAGRDSYLSLMRFNLGAFSRALR